MSEPRQLPDKIAFEYVKVATHRVLHVDGVIGAVSPTGEFLTASLFVERRPIPKRTVFDLDAQTGRLGDQRMDEREERDAIIREVDTTIVLSLDAARRLIQWLSQQIPHLESAQTQKREIAGDLP